MRKISTEKLLYIISILLIVSGGIFIAVYFALIDYMGYNELLNCRMKAIFGIPCPGCGGTRSLKALLKGDILSSLRYNSFATYSVVMYLIFFVTNTLDLISGGKVKGMKFHLIYLWIAIVILIGQYVFKLVHPYFMV